MVGRMRFGRGDLHPGDAMGGPTRPTVPGCGVGDHRHRRRRASPGTSAPGMLRAGESEGTAGRMARSSFRTAGRRFLSARSLPPARYVAEAGHPRRASGRTFRPGPVPQPGLHLLRGISAGRSCPTAFRTASTGWSARFGQARATSGIQPGIRALARAHAHLPPHGPNLIRICTRGGPDRAGSGSGRGDGDRSPECPTGRGRSHT